MKTVCSPGKCNACMACVNGCSFDAIKIVDVINKYNAIIDMDKCKKCNACFNICPVNNKADLLSTKYSKQGWSLDSNIRKKSSSGGIATTISKKFIQEGGKVCTCAFEKGSFTFSIIDDVKDLRKIQGSKYVKSNPNKIYRDVKYLLSNNKKVLFIGLPCQVAGLKSYVGNELGKKLYTIDLICHGTPSPEILNSYLKSKKIDHFNIKDISFRQGNEYGLKIYGAETNNKIRNDSYLECFLKGICYTENCFECPYATKDRVGDLTLGDSWGTNIADFENGISLILCQTGKGNELIDSNIMHLETVDYVNAISNNHQLRHPSIKPKRYNLFINGFKHHISLDVLLLLCYPKSFLKNLKRLVKF